MDQKYDGDVCGLHRRFAGRGLVYVKCCTRNSSRQDKDRHIKIAYTYAITWNCKTKCSSQVPICLYSRLCSSTHLHSIYISMMMLMMIRLDIDEWMSIILSFSIHSFIPHFLCVCVYPSMMMMIIIIIFYKCLTNNPIISYVYFKWFEIEVQMFSITHSSTCCVIDWNILGHSHLLPFDFSLFKHCLLHSRDLYRLNNVQCLFRRCFMMIRPLLFDSVFWFGLLAFVYLSLFATLSAIFLSRTIVVCVCG